MTTFDLLLIGYGNVARRLVTLLEEQRATLAGRYGFQTRIIGIATRRDGARYVVPGFGRARPAPPGREHQAAPSLAEARAHSAGTATTTASAIDFIRDACARDRPAARERRLVVVETTTLDVTRGEPATSHVRAALAGGAHVVTTNKGPAAFAYRSLIRAAERAGRRLLFEGAVMDGVPVFNLVRETLPAVTILGFRGVVNSTTNHVLTAMEQGQPFGEALAEMRAMGIAEADASLDVDGWDAAAKTAALANVLLDAAITPHDVERQGVSEDTGRAAREARAAGRRIKLVARAGRDGDRITARVAPEALPDDDLLAGLEGQQNAIILHTDVLKEIAVVQRGGSLTETAYALLSDLVTIAREVSPSPATPRSRRSAPRGRSPSRRARQSR
jgi:homoserine dehydrogenase